MGKRPTQFQKSFAARTVTKWNSLPDSITSLASVWSFRSQLSAISCPLPVGVHTSLPQYPLSTRQLSSRSRSICTATLFFFTVLDFCFWSVTFSFFEKLQFWFVFHFFPSLLACQSEWHKSFVALRSSFHAANVFFWHCQCLVVSFFTVQVAWCDVIKTKFYNIQGESKKVAP